MNLQDHCIVWIHGIGETPKGYSDKWRAMRPFYKISLQTRFPNHRHIDRLYGCKRHLIFGRFLGIIIYK
jgi:hypothetical protein